MPFHPDDLTPDVLYTTNVRRIADLATHTLDEIRDDFHRIVYAASGEAARTTFAAFERTWAKRCPDVVTSLREGSTERLTFFRFPRRSGRRCAPQT